MSQYLFYLLAFISIFTSLLVISAKNPIHSVLYLIITFFAIAGQYVLLNNQFLAIVHIIVYAGAIMVLFLFVLMLLNLNTQTEPAKSNIMKIIAVLSACLLGFVLFSSFAQSNMPSPMGLPNDSNGLVGNLGKILFNEYVVPFELSSLLFLSAMIGTVLLGKREVQNINKPD